MRERVIEVAVGSATYPVHVGLSLERRLTALLDSRRIAVVTDSYLERGPAESWLEALQRAGVSLEVVRVPRGERAKSLAVLDRIYRKLLRARVERRTPIVALGGGSIGDVAGLAAATYQRGLPLVHVPTTLLAQTDSSIGGKTAIDHGGVKNAVGTFYQPRFVLSDLGFLATLSARQMRAGLAEVVKLALLFDGELARWLERRWDGLVGDPPRRNAAGGRAADLAALGRVVARSVELKAAAIRNDEHDLAGRRELLNLGHSVGHALEALVDPARLTHGEAVAWGLKVALELSRARGWLRDPSARELAERLVARLEPPRLPRLDCSRVVKAMRWDKKVRAGRPVLVLLRDIGEPARVADAGEREIGLALVAAGVARGRS